MRAVTLSHAPGILSVMQKSMEAISVHTDEGKVVLEQDSQDENEGVQTIRLNPAQIPLLISWLDEAAKDAQS